MNIKREIKTIRNLLHMSQEELANELLLPYETINRWENTSCNVDEYNVERIYAYAYEKKIKINEIYEQMTKETYESEYCKILYHGSKKKMVLPVDLNHSKKQNDFGDGFYLGEGLKQAVSYISNVDSTKVYLFSMNFKDLNICRFGVNREWMLAIAYYRGWINQYKDYQIVKDIIKKVESADVIIANIADNRMFDIISEFVRGEITDAQCEHCLAKTDLGLQYVIRTKKALEQLQYINICHISKPEKDENLKSRLDDVVTAIHKVAAARIEYKNVGEYIGEIYK